MAGLLAIPPNNFLGAYLSSQFEPPRGTMISKPQFRSLIARRKCDLEDVVIPYLNAQRQEELFLAINEVANNPGLINRISNLLGFVADERSLSPLPEHSSSSTEASCGSSSPEYDI